MHSPSAKDYEEEQLYQTLPGRKPEPHLSAHEEQELLKSVTADNMHRLAQSNDVLCARSAETVRFNIMVCGPAGVGKSSFIDLFLKKFNLKAAKEKLDKESSQEKDQLKT